MNKKGEKFSVNKRVMIFLFLIASIAIFSLNSIKVNGQGPISTLYEYECDPARNTSTCGLLITTTGHGAVELCQTCHVCGVLDGVCPEDFSDGTPELDYNKTRVLLRVGQDRPSSFDIKSNPVLYNTGILGCQEINGTCTGIETKALESGNWMFDLGYTCNSNVNSDGLPYMRAVCTAPKTAGCQYCPDPDCITTVIGVTYDNVTNIQINAKVNIVSLNGALRAEQTSTGSYSMNPFRGNVKVICTAQDYEVTNKNVFLQRGQNIVDCAMNEAACSPQCTLPDINGNAVCAARCDDQNLCNYANDETKAICDGVRLGNTVVVNRTNSTHVTAVNCCMGDFEQIYRPIYGLDANNIPNLLTRDYRKFLNGIPITLRIITYKKE